MQRKAIFDTVRDFIGRSFRRAEITRLDAAIDRAWSDASASAASSNSPCPRTIGDAGVQLIKRFEGCARLRTDGRVEAYPDPGTGGHPWTIGWGATGPAIGPGTIWSRAQCDERLEQDLKRYSADVARALGDAPTNQSQFDAMVSFHYNTGAIASATLTKKHLAGDFDAALQEFSRWNRAGGRVLKGLVRRRAEEADLYANGG